MLMKQFVFALFFTLSSIVYCQNVSEKHLKIDPFLSLQNYEHFKRLCLNSSDQQIDFIQGFEFEWGYEYQLIVKQTKLKQSLTDGTNYTYSLDKIVSKVKVADTTQFKLFLDAHRYYYQLPENEIELNNTFKQLNDSVFLYFDNVEIVVPQSLKNDFDSIVDGSIRKFGNFVFENKNRIRLIGILP